MTAPLQVPRPARNALAQEVFDTVCVEHPLSNVTLADCTVWVDLIAEKIAARIDAVGADPDRTRPPRPDAGVPTDYANDFTWAAMIARGDV